MPDRLKMFTAGLTFGAALIISSSIFMKSRIGRNLLSGLRQKYHHLLEESADAADVRRQELRERLAVLISPPSAEETS